MTSSESPQRRKYLRFPANSKVWWSSDGKPQLIRIYNISAGGMLCALPVQLNLGTKVQIHFDFQPEGQLVYCDCKVAHVRPDEQGEYLTGLRIVALEGCELGELISYVRQA